MSPNNSFGPHPHPAKWLAWTGTSWRPRAFLLLTTALVILLASNPELAPIIPVLDALGLDVLLYLFAARLSFLVGGMLLPFVRHAIERGGRGAIRCASLALGCFIGGYPRQLLWHMKQAGVVIPVLVSNNPSRPNPLRKSIHPR